MTIKIVPSSVEIGGMFMKFNGLHFAPLDHSTLHDSCEGFYALNEQRGIWLYKRDKSLAAFIVCNPNQGYFVVTASLAADQASPRYMFSTCSSEEIWLQLEGMGMMAILDAVQGIEFVEFKDRPKSEKHQIKPSLDLDGTPWRDEYVYREATIRRNDSHRGYSSHWTARIGSIRAGTIQRFQGMTRKEVIRGIDAFHMQQAAVKAQCR